MTIDRRFLAVPPFLLVLLVAGMVEAGGTIGFDQAAMRALAPSPALLPLVRGVSLFGNTTTRFVIAAVVVLALLLWRRWRQAAALAATVLGGAALNSLAKLLVARPRPDLFVHLDRVTSTSFPSGHSAGAVTTYVAIAMVLGAGRAQWIGPAVAVALLIGLSRIALAVHWPSDVIAGWALGIGWLLLWRDALAGPPPPG